MSSDDLLPGAGHWGARFFGELYRLTTLPLLAPAQTARDVAVLARLLALPPGAVVLDLGCGHGRHAVPLALGGLRVVGLELDEPSLGLAAVAARGSGASLSLLRAELTELPLRDESLDGAFAFYSSLFIWDDVTNARVLAAIAAGLRPGGRFVHQSIDPAALAARPRGSVRLPLPRGGEVLEESRFDPTTGRDEGVRTALLPGGRSLSARFSIRYPAADELAALALGAGFVGAEILRGPQLGLGDDALVLVAKR